MSRCMQTEGAPASEQPYGGTLLYNNKNTASQSPVLSNNGPDTEQLFSLQDGRYGPESNHENCDAYRLKMTIDFPQ